MKKIFLTITMFVAGLSALPIILTACSSTTHNQQGSNPTLPETPPIDKPPVVDPPVDKPEWEKPPVDVVKNTEYKHITETNYHFLKNLGIKSTWHKETIENDLVYQMDLLKEIYIKEYIRGFHKLDKNSLRYVTIMIRYINNKYYANVFFQGLPGSIFKYDKQNTRPVELQLQIELLKDNESIIG